MHCVRHHPDAHTPLSLPCNRCAGPLPGPTCGTLIRMQRLSPTDFRHRQSLRRLHSLHGYSDSLLKRSRWSGRLVARPTQKNPALCGAGTFADFLDLISGDRIQKLPLTCFRMDFPCPAPSPLELTGKGLSPLSSLSFSRPHFGGTRRLSASG